MNSNMLTGRFYTMDPETEDLIRGEALKNGMVVMIEGNFVREDPESKRNSKYAYARLMENNRWCEITDLRFRGYDSDDSSRLVDFIGVYEDGTKASRSFSTAYAWFVKKDSIPKTETYPEPGTVVDEKEFDLHEQAIGEVTDIREDQDGLHLEGVLNYALDDTDTTLENEEDYGPTNSGVDEDDDDLPPAPSLEEGPMVRALRLHDTPPQLREKRTVNQTEVVEIYSPGRSVFGSPFYSGRRGW